MAYIPEKHKKYGLLPFSVENGSEVFSYPSGLVDAIEELIFELEDVPEDSDCGRVSLLIPYAVKSYEDYQVRIESYIEKYPEHEVADLLKLLSQQIRRMNVKEDWPIVRYVGHEFDGDKFAPLTAGRCYYWPCSRENPTYEGVIDNEEFTSYLYPCSADSWEVVEDPTGMAQRALDGEADTVSAWKFEDESPENAELVENIGIRPKRASGSCIPFEFSDFNWSESEQDSLEITCPSCGKPITFMAQTLLNALDCPDAANALKEGGLFNFVCDSCGFEAGVPHPCLYLDPMHGACVYFVVNEQMRDGVEAMFAAQSREPESKGIRFRIVDDRRVLREKVLAFDACLDDRALEMLKVGIRGQAKMQGLVSLDNECDVFLEGVKGSTLSFALCINEERFVVDMERTACELFEADINNSDFKEAQPFFIDERWAHAAMDELQG